MERDAVIQTQFCDRNTIFGAILTIMFRRRNIFTPELWKYQNRTKFLIFMVLPIWASYLNRLGKYTYK